MAILRRASLALAGALVLLAALAAYWYYSPYLVMRTLHQAAQAGDVDTINEHVDFPRLRESLKTQLGAAMLGSLKTAPDNPFAALGASVATAMVNGVVEVMVGPQMLMYSLRHGLAQEPHRAGERPAPAAAPPGPPAGAQDPPPERGQARWRMERLGPDRVVFHPRDEDPGKAVGMVFERHGFAGWKLVAMQLALSTRRQ